MATVSGWGEVALFSLLFISVLTLVVADFNLNYHKNYQNPFYDGSNTTQAFVDAQDTQYNNLKGGQVDANAYSGISVKSSWGVLLDFAKISWNFVNGNFIREIGMALNLGEAGMALVTVLQVLYFLSIIAALLYVLFKVVF